MPSACGRESPARTRRLALALARRICSLHETVNHEEFLERFAQIASGMGSGTFALVLVHEGGCRLEAARSCGRPVSGEVALGAELLAASAQGKELRGDGATLTVGGESLPVGSAFPLVFRQEPYGLLLAGDAIEPDSAEEDAWRFLAAQVSARMVTSQLYQETASEAQSAGARLRAVADLGELLAGLDLEVLLVKIMELALKIVEAQVGCLVVAEREGDETSLRTRVEWGLDDATVHQLRDPQGRLFVEKVLERREPVLLVDPGPKGELDTSGLQVRIDSLLAVPLSTKSRAIGVLLIVNTDETSRFTGRELEVLNTMAGIASHALENAILYQESLERQRIQQQLNIARDIQRSLLPERFPVLESFDVAGWSLACDETGGDYYDCIELPGDRLALVVGDVSGHGLGSALFMTTARAVLRSLVGSIEDISAIMSRTNDLLEHDMEDDKFMTLFFGIIDLERRVMHYSSAGHDAPFLYRAAGGRFEDLESTGLPLGMIAGSDFPTVDDIPLAPGDILTFGTDGVWEAMSASGEQFGKERVCSLVVEHRGDSAEAIVGAIRDAVRDFCGQTPQRDDLTLCVVKVTG